MPTCGEVTRVVKSLMAATELEGNLYVVGGIVPWLLSGVDSGRLHSDLDLVVPLAKMSQVRAYLQRSGAYNQEMDSLYLAINKEGKDHGLEALCQGVPVNFAPFVVEGDAIIQRNVALTAVAGFDALLTATLRPLALPDYLAFYRLPDGQKIGCYTLEMIRATKEASAREKDLLDLAQLAAYQIDLQRYARVKPAVTAMEITCLTQAETEGKDA